jgi:hippurate hydrolase
MPDFRTAAAAIADDLTALRHEFHRHPEPGLDLPWTQARVLKALAGLPLEVTTGTSLSSVTAVLRGGAAPADIAARPVVLLRADMDGLPVPEQTGQPYASELDNRMHACGHDLHMTTLIGAARLLVDVRDELPGDVVFMFQPAEEILSGAIRMVDEGVLDAAGKRADLAFGMHAFSSVFESGTWATRPGVLMAASDPMIVDIIGKGGHGSTAHLANDPVPVMAEIITALQVMVTRHFNVFDPVVVNVGVARAGDAANVIPEKCHIECSIRTFSPEHRAKIKKLASELVRGIAEARGMRVEIEWGQGTAPTMCDADATDLAVRSVVSVVGESRHATMAQPFAGSEDFSEVLSRVPGSFVCYSAVRPGRSLDTTTFNHSATAEFDDDPIVDATAVFATIGWDALAEVRRRFADL